MTEKYFAITKWVRRYSHTRENVRKSDKKGLGTAVTSAHHDQK